LQSLLGVTLLLSLLVTLLKDIRHRWRFRQVLLLDRQRLCHSLSVTTKRTSGSSITHNLRLLLRILLVKKVLQRVGDVRGVR